jgi:hypothetical protein
LLHRTLSRRGRVATSVGLVAAVSAAALSLPLFTQTASADTTVNNVTTLATTPTQSNVASNNTLTGLNNGDMVTLTINASSPATVGGFEARQCAGGVNITNDFGFDPSSTPNCLDAEFSPAMQSGAYATYAAAPPFSTVSGTFQVGTGTRNTGLGTITCNSANPCSLWLRESVSSNVTTAWIHYNLQFAAAPAVPVAPAAPTASLTGNTATVNWVAPSGSNPAITGYKVTPFLNGVPQAEIVTGNVTTLNVPGLVDFSSYTFAVKATNALGDSPLSAQSSPALIPTPTGPTNVQATSPGTGAATVTWTAPAVTAGLTGYTVTPTPAAPPVTVGAGTTTASFTGLTDGVSYTFVVTAQYGASGSGAPSAPSAPVAIGGRSVDQYIIATRPAGQLDIAEACANNNAAYPDNPGVPGGPNPTPIPAPATDPAFGLYPQTCAVNLGTGVLNAASTHYVATGNINPVSVRDLRSTDTGWSVNTTLTQFTSGTTTTPFPANCLAVTPTFTELSNVPTVYDQHVTVLGHGLVPAETTAAGPAFGGTCDGGAAALSTAGVMTAASAHGLGRADLTAGLNLKIPVSSQAGTYQAKLTFTVLGN